MPIGTGDYADIQAVEPGLRRFYSNKMEKLTQYPSLTMMLWKRASQEEVNALMNQYTVETYGNPQIGRGSATDGFPTPGSPAIAALFFGPLWCSITGGIDGDALDNEKSKGMSAGQVVAKRTAGDLEMLLADLNQNIFHGNTGERAVSLSTTTAPVLSGGNTTVTFNTEWGVKHLNPGGTYTFHSSAGVLRGSAGGYQCLSKDPETRTAVFAGDLTGIGLADSDTCEMKGHFNADWDGLPEFLGNSGWYGGQNRTTEFLFRGIRVDGQSKNLSIGILERCDTRMMYAGDGKYNASARIDLTSPTQSMALNAIGWAQVVFNDNVVPDLGFTAIRYKGRTLVIDRDCSPLEWYQIDLSTMRRLVLHEIELFPGATGAGGGHITYSTTTGTVMDKYHWVHFGKGQRACLNSRKNLLLHTLGTTGLEMGDIF